VDRARASMSAEHGMMRSPRVGARTETEAEAEGAGEGVRDDDNGSVEVMTRSWSGVDLTEEVEEVGIGELRCLRR
jgi:hypothetical protein